MPYPDFVKAVGQYGWKGISDGVLREMLLQGGEAALPRRFSLLKEIIFRQTGLSLFDSQLAAAYVMYRGQIAELPTGEGKTLAAVVAAACLALEGMRVHILVCNDYLAQRDSTANRAVYAACGLGCACVTERTARQERRKAYGCEVVYLSAKEAAFDYLRDFLCMEREDLVFGGFSAALADEADSLLLDEARVPLVLAGEMGQEKSQARQVCKAVALLSEEDVGQSSENRQVWLSDSGVRKMERMLSPDLYTGGNEELLALLGAALEARFLLCRDRDYIVAQGAVRVVEETTGRVAEKRRFPDLLQQAVEIREGVEAGQPSTVLHSMSLQAFLRQYPFLCGMTGTAKCAERELRRTYGLTVETIPPHCPCVRADRQDKVFRTREEQREAILRCVWNCRSENRPVLVGTGSVEESECLSRLLAAHGLPHSVLNARNDQQEAAIIARAGEPGRTIISTNLSGRGVDIRLGGADGSRAEQVRKTGGLLVLGTRLNRSLRIDNQLRGRAGRQGDPGESQFFLCLEDLDAALRPELEFYLPEAYPKLLRRAQKWQEGEDAEARYMLERYSAVLEERRQAVTEYRMGLLLGKAVPHILERRAYERYTEMERRYGKDAILRAETQLTLALLNRNWACYLEAMEAFRSGVHLVLVGGMDPLTEYRKFATSAFGEMTEDIQNEVVEAMGRCRITENGVDLEEAGLAASTATWSYCIDESSSQFSRLPVLARAVSRRVKGAAFSVRRLVDGCLRRYSKRRMP